MNRSLYSGRIDCSCGYVAYRADYCEAVNDATEHEHDHILEDPKNLDEDGNWAGDVAKATAVCRVCGEDVAGDWPLPEECSNCKEGGDE